jgi:DNA sulfur modification protein DndB
MATAIPAMRASFGSTEYFVITMGAKELSERLVIPKEMDGWDNMSIEERFQREVNYDRVRKHIAPYLASDPDRFFGAFIVDLFNAERVNFEPMSQITKDLPKLYKEAADTFGFLYLSGKEVMVPLDGQHRLAAIKFAISGKDEKGKPIEGLKGSIDVASDICTVILIKHDPKKARSIFNKVNRYAKATSRADNLITADDDIVAIISREEIANNVITSRLVNFESNTLSDKAIEFTTLNVIYEITGSYLENFLEGTASKIDRGMLPPAPTQKLFRDNAKKFWQTVLGEVQHFQTAIHSPDDSYDEKRRELRRDFTILKPINQLALIEAIIRLIQPRADGTRIEVKKICEKINKVDWSVENSLWQHVLMNGNKVVTGKSASKFAARFIAYLLGDELQDKELDALKKLYFSFFPAGSTPKFPDRLKL